MITLFSLKNNTEVVNYLCLFKNQFSPHLSAYKLYEEHLWGANSSGLSMYMWELTLPSNNMVHDEICVCWDNLVRNNIDGL